MPYLEVIGLRLIDVPLTSRANRLSWVEGGWSVFVFGDRCAAKCATIDLVLCTRAVWSIYRCYRMLVSH